VKKIILGLLVVVSLYGSAYSCKLYTERYDSSIVLIGFAVDRKDLKDSAWHSKTALSSLENMIAYCKHSKEDKKRLEGMRDILKELAVD